MDELETRLGRVRERIATAALRAGRDPQGVTLVAVTKTVPAEVVAAVWQMGLCDHFGENRVEEARHKIPEVTRLLHSHGKAMGDDSPAHLCWHMIGHVQSRKAREVVSCFDWVHSVDSLKLASRLSRYAVEAGRRLPILLEANVSGEPGKYGFALGGWPEDRGQTEAFFAAVSEILALPGLRLLGLMTIAPIVPEPEAARPIFRRLRALRDALAERFPATDWPHLSMGMTDDFEVAVEEGATFVRIGRAIFGERLPDDMRPAASTI